MNTFLAVCIYPAYIGTCFNHRKTTARLIDATPYAATKS